MFKNYTLINFNEKVSQLKADIARYSKLLKHPKTLEQNKSLIFLKQLEEEQITKLSNSLERHTAIVNNDSFKENVSNQKVYNTLFGTLTRLLEWGYASEDIDLVAPALGLIKQFNDYYNNNELQQVKTITITTLELFLQEIPQIDSFITKYEGTMLDVISGRPAPKLRRLEEDPRILNGIPESIVELKSHLPIYQTLMEEIECKSSEIISQLLNKSLTPEIPEQFVYINYNPSVYSITRLDEHTNIEEFALYKRLCILYALKHCPDYFEFKVFRIELLKCIQYELSQNLNTNKYDAWYRLATEQLPNKVKKVYRGYNTVSR